MPVFCPSHSRGQHCTGMGHELVGELRIRHGGLILRRRQLDPHEAVRGSAPRAPAGTRESASHRKRHTVPYVSLSLRDSVPQGYCAFFLPQGKRQQARVNPGLLGAKRGRDYGFVGPAPVRPRALRARTQRVSRARSSGRGHHIASVSVSVESGRAVGVRRDSCPKVFHRRS